MISLKEWEDGLCGRPVVFLYHKNCNDGLGALAAFMHYSLVAKVTYVAIAVSRDDNPDEICKNYIGDDIVIADFSFKRHQLEHMHSVSNSLIVIDHHDTAMKDLKDLPYCLFDMEHSGAILTWNYFLPATEPPLILKYIEDRDIWKWELPDSRAIAEGMVGATIEDIYPSKSGYLEQVKVRGAPLLEATEKRIRDYTTRVHPIVTLDGYKGPMVNISDHKLVSETLSRLSEGHDFAISYRMLKDHVEYSLRSRKGGCDVGSIAVNRGGGGHKQAAGFKVGYIDNNQSIEMARPDDA